MSVAQDHRSRSRLSAQPRPRGRRRRGPRTWAALVVEVKRGSRGDAVRGVQKEFQFRNLSGDPTIGVQIDGVFGPATESAVRGFQQALQLSADGIVGPLTWRALVSGMLLL